MVGQATKRGGTAVANGGGCHQLPNLHQIKQSYMQMKAHKKQINFIPWGGFHRKADGFAEICKKKKLQKS